MSRASRLEFPTKPRHGFPFPASITNQSLGKVSVAHFDAKTPIPRKRVCSCPRCGKLRADDARLGECWEFGLTFRRHAAQTKRRRIQSELEKVARGNRQ
jgi:hypothetical protein